MTAHRSMNPTYVVVGGWNSYCDRCGQKRKSTDLVNDVWPKNGLFVCRDTCLDKFQPQDIVHVPVETQNVPITRTDAPVLTDGPQLTTFISG